MPKSNHISENSTIGKKYKKTIKKMQDDAPKRDKYDIGRQQVEVVDKKGKVKKIEALRIDIEDWMINLKRQLMDFLYEHKRKHKRILRLKTPAGYYQLFSPEQLLKEIENETVLGKRVLTEVKSKQDLLDLLP